MSVRMYAITYEEDGDTYAAVIPEWLLPEIETILDIEVVGNLMEGYLIVEDSEPDPGEKEPIPLKTVNGK